MIRACFSGIFPAGDSRRDAKKADQLGDNISATALVLSDDEMKRLDDVSALVPEYPGWMVDRQMTDRTPG